MSELTEVEWGAVRYWRGIGGYTNFDITTKIIESRHHVEHLRVYRELEDK